jgi:RNA polymerase sigma factor (sigma-70 family)
MDAGIDPVGRDPFQAFIERDALLAGLVRLTPDERIVVVLRFWADLPLEAIAQRLEWPLGTVKSRLHRALERLRGALEPDSEEAIR